MCIFSGPSFSVQVCLAVSILQARGTSEGITLSLTARPEKVFGGFAWILLLWCQSVSLSPSLHLPVSRPLWSEPSEQGSRIVAVFVVAAAAAASVQVLFASCEALLKLLNNNINKKGCIILIGHSIGCVCLHTDLFGPLAATRCIVVVVHSTNQSQSLGKFQ